MDIGFLPGSQADSLCHIPLIPLLPASISTSGGTASSVETRLQKPTTATINASSAV